MRLVRGSILSLKPCSTSQASRILRRFLGSDEGTDISAKSFLERAARALESMSEGGHTSEKKKRRLDPQTSQDFENPKNPNEGKSGLEHQDDANGSKILDSGKHRKKREKSYLEGLTTEVGVKLGEEAMTEESRKLAKMLREKHELEGGERKADSGLCVTPLVGKSEKWRRANGMALISMEIKELDTEKRRKKGRKLGYEENHDHDHDDFREKMDLEMETPATHKKRSKRERSDDGGTLDEVADLVFSSSKRSKQGKHHANEVKEIDEKHHSKRKGLETEAEVFADGQEFHSIKKKRKDKTPK